VRLPSASNKRKGSPCASEKRPSQPYSKETSTIYYATAMSTAKILLYTKTPIATPKTTISTPESIMPTSLYLQ
ncbi:unnamed protein product, partial [Ascophyllum nodosum]